jgi:hypothetical protein
MKNEWSYTSTPPSAFRGGEGTIIYLTPSQIEHNDNYEFNMDFMGFN